jgi:hypothetical protein
VVALKDLEGAWGQIRHRLPELARVLRQEMPGERRHVCAPLAKRGNDDRHHVKAIVQVLPEPARCHRLTQIRVAGGDDAGVDPDRPPSAYPLDLTLLQGPQELRLEVEPEHADLVQKQRAGVRYFEFSELPCVGAREGAPFVPEQLRLEQLGRQRSAVHGHEGAVAAAALPVDRACNQLLARAGLSTDEHRGRRVSDPAHEVVHSTHRGRSADQLVEALVPRQLAPEVPHLPLQGAPLESAVDRPAQVVHRDRLRQVVRSAELYRLDGGADGSDGSDEDHLQAGVEVLESLEHFHPLHAREAHVEEAHVHVVCPHGLDRGAAASGLEHLTRAVERLLDACAHPWLIVDDDYHGAIGTRHERGSPAGLSDAGRVGRMHARLP